MPSKISGPRICVFCSTKSGIDESGPKAARELAQALHKHDVDLVYGGGTTGLMGELSRERTRLGGMSSVTGVIPYALVDRERNVEGNLATSRRKLSRLLSHIGANNKVSIPQREQLGDDVAELPPDPGYGRVVGVPSLGRRKAVMMDIVNNGGAGSGYIALPGGLGSLDEILEVVTHRQLGVHSFPMVLVNVDGFWDGMKIWIGNAHAKGYLGAEGRDLIKVVGTAEEAVQYLATYQVSIC